MSEDSEYYTGDEYEAEDRGCDYDFGDECVDLLLRGLGMCFECWLFREAEEDAKG